MLADADAAGAVFLITDDVDDFAEADLVVCGISAVTADVFMATRFTGAAYTEALVILTENRSRPPDTPEAMHRALGRQHPRLTRRFGHLFRRPPEAPTHPEPKVLFRGDRCLGCRERQSPLAELQTGLCESCREV
jgi:hypothetical protein